MIPHEEFLEEKSNDGSSFVLRQSGKVNFSRYRHADIEKWKGSLDGTGRFHVWEHQRSHHVGKYLEGHAFETQNHQQRASD
jgi:hypothetical protein